MFLQNQNSTCSDFVKQLNTFNVHCHTLDSIRQNAIPTARYHGTRIRTCTIKAQSSTTLRFTTGMKRRSIYAPAFFY